MTALDWIVTLAGAAMIALVNLYFLGPRRR